MVCIDCLALCAVPLIAQIMIYFRAFLEKDFKKASRSCFSKSISTPHELILISFLIQSGKGGKGGKGGKAPTSKKQICTRSSRAGLQVFVFVQPEIEQFPVGRIHRLLKRRVTNKQRVGATAAVYVQIVLKPPL